MKNTLITSSLLVVGSLQLQAATIVTNNTGIDSSLISILDNFDAGVTDNRTGTIGNDGGTNTFGNVGWWSNGGNVQYSFTGLTVGQTFNIYVTWYNNGDTSAIGVDANGVDLGNFSITNAPDISQGFTANDQPDTAGDGDEPFQFIGTGVVDNSGELLVTLTPEGANGFGRYDAVAIAPIAVPEPSTSGLLGLAGLGLILRRKR